ncbi:MAG: NADPH-dependent oxidoreductase [Phycisphaerales bacterium JB059]
MNPIIEQMHAHRSVRRYTEEPVEHEHLLEAVRAGQGAATSSAVQAYCAIRVTSPETRRAIAQLAGPQEKIELAPEFLVVCADTRRRRLICARDGIVYNQRLEAFLVGAIDASLFAQNMTLALESMGYGTCYIGGIRNDIRRLDELLGLPEGVYPLFGLCVGRPAETPAPRPRLDVGAILFDDAYPDDETVNAQTEAYDEAYRAYLRQRGAPPEQVDRSWSRAVSARLGTPSRVELGAYYTDKGACFDLE